MAVANTAVKYSCLNAASAPFTASRVSQKLSDGLVTVALHFRNVGSTLFAERNARRAMVCVVENSSRPEHPWISYFALGSLTDHVCGSPQRAACRSSKPRVYTGNPGKRTGRTCGFSLCSTKSNLGHPSPLVIPTTGRDLQCALRLSPILASGVSD